MPIYNRRTIRQRLGREILRDTIVGNTSGCWGTQAGSYNIVDSSLADPTASGEQLYHRQGLRLLGSAGKLQDVRVASFNTGSGAFVGAQTLATTVFSGMPYEVHALIDPVEKDLMIDTIIRDVKIRKELSIWSIDGGHIYSIGDDVIDIEDVRYFADPAASLDYDERGIQHFRFVRTVLGRELRIEPSLGASAKLILKAITTVSLGVGDLATVNLPSDDLVIWGAAARCYWLLEQKSPAQDSSAYRFRRKDAAKHYTRLAVRFMPKISRRLQLDLPW